MPSGLGFIAARVGLGPPKVKRLLLALRVPMMRTRSPSLRKAAKKQKQRWGESDVPVGLIGWQERQSHGQLSSAFLEGLDKPKRLAAVQSIFPSSSGGGVKPLECRSLPAIGCTDEPGVCLPGESCVGRAAPLLNIRQGWRASQEKGQEWMWRRQEGDDGNVGSTEAARFPGVSRTEGQGGWMALLGLPGQPNSLQSTFGSLGW